MVPRGIRSLGGAPALWFGCYILSERSGGQVLKVARLFRPSSSLGGATRHAFLGCGAPAHRFLGWRSGAQVPWVLRGTLLRWRSGAEVAWVALHRSFFFRGMLPVAKILIQPEFNPNFRILREKLYIWGLKCFGSS